MRAFLRIIVAAAFTAAAFMVPIGSEAATVPAPAACDTTKGACWRPAVGTRWQYQLQGVAAYASTGGINVNISAVPVAGGAAVRPQVFDIDLYVDQAVSGNNSTLATAATSAIHANGAKAICYVSAGTWENWRPDAGDFPASVLGAKNGWPGEKWLDIRQTSTLLPIMQARVQKCAQAGFDGVEFDNVDGYANRSGFPLTDNDQQVYNASLANLAHGAGLTVALKNDLGQASSLKPYFDYSINEQCFQYRECDYPPPGLPDWVASGKAVFNVEYKKLNCPSANTWNFGSILKTLDLYETPWTPCR
jgi:hypothetical protein